MITLGSLCLHAAQLMKHAKYSSSDSPLQNYEEGIQFGLINTAENNSTLDQNGNCWISLTSIEVRSSVDEDIANVSIIQMYENKSEETMEVHYCFPIHPDGGTFVNFKADVDGESVKDVSKLEVTDEDNVSSGLADGVLEFIHWILKGNKPAIFKVPICSVNPGSFVQIRLGYEYKLKNFSNTLQFFIPKSIVPAYNREEDDIDNNDYSAAHLSIKVNVLVKGLIESLESPSHPGIVVAGKIEDPAKKGWTQAQVKFSGDSKDMKNDFLLLIKKSKGSDNGDSGVDETTDETSADVGLGVVPSIIKPSLDAFGGVCYDSVANDIPCNDNNNKRHSIADMLLAHQTITNAEDIPFFRGSVDYSIMKALEKAYIANATLQSEKPNVAKETVKKSQNFKGQSLFNNSGSSDLESIQENELSDVDSRLCENIEEKTIPEENMSDIVEDSAIESSDPKDLAASEENQDQFVEGFQSFHGKSGIYLEKKKSTSNFDDSTNADEEQNHELPVKDITTTEDDALNIDEKEPGNESSTAQPDSKEVKTPETGVTTTAKAVTQKKFNFSQPRTTKLQISRANLIAKSSLAALAKKLNENDESYQKAKVPYRKPSLTSTVSTPTQRPATSGVNRTSSYSSTLKKPNRASVNSGSTAANRSPSLDRKKGNNVTFANAHPPKPLVSDKDVTKILVNLQTASGSFELSPILIALLSQDLDNVRQIARDNGWADSSVATAMSLAFFTVKLTDQKSSWNSAFEKGKKWLHAHFPKKADQIMEYMNQNIFHE